MLLIELPPPPNPLSVPIYHNIPSSLTFPNSCEFAVCEFIFFKEPHEILVIVNRNKSITQHDILPLESCLNRNFSKASQLNS